MSEINLNAITVDDCILMKARGYDLVIEDGNVKGFEKEGVMKSTVAFISGSVIPWSSLRTIFVGWFRNMKLL